MVVRGSAFRAAICTSREYAGIWRDADKVVKETSGSDLSIGGAGIAAEAFRHGLVDECVLLLCPVLVGGGKPALPRGVRLNLELLDHGRFDNGVVYVRHAVRHPA